MSDEQSTCPHCGNPVSQKLLGMCPQCMLKAGLGGFSAEGSIPDQPASRFIPPTVEELGRYFPQLEILELIGRGGMGAVYKARQKQLDRLVALKILPPGIGSGNTKSRTQNTDREPNPDATAFAQRFTREAKALAALAHPNIVTLYEFGQAFPGPRTSSSAPSAPSDPPDLQKPTNAPLPPIFFFLMEYVDGMNLRQLLAGGRLAPKEALAIVPHICDALQYAHDRGIVHRDIKPENILLGRDGVVKIADFGVAKIIGQVPPVPSLAEFRTSEPASDAPATTSEKVMGTPAYMAPEQLDRPAEVDHRADIYSLGVVLYQMLTGELPAKQIEPPSRKVQIDVRIDEIVMRALERDPDMRYSQASVFKTEVETVATAQARFGPPTQPTSPPPVRTGSRRHSRPLLSAAIVALLCGVATFLALRPTYMARGILFPTMTTDRRTAIQRHVLALQEPAFLKTAMATLKPTLQTEPLLRLTPAQLAAQLAVKYDSATDLISVCYTDSDPSRAALAAETIIRAYCAVASPSDQTLTVVVWPEVPGPQRRPEGRLLLSGWATVLGGALGALVLRFGRVPWRSVNKPLTGQQPSPPPTVDTIVAAPVPALPTFPTGGEWFGALVYIRDGQRAINWRCVVISAAVMLVLGAVPLGSTIGFPSWLLLWPLAGTVLGISMAIYLSFQLPTERLTRRPGKIPQWVVVAVVVSLTLMWSVSSYFQRKSMTSQTLQNAILSRQLGKFESAQKDSPSNAGTATRENAVVTTPPVGLPQSGFVERRSIPVSNPRQTPDGTAEMTPRAPSTSRPSIIPADVPVQPGQTAEFYMGGKVQRVGVYSFSGTPRITLKQALVAAGLNPGSDMSRYRVTLVRRYEKDGEYSTAINLAQLLSGVVPDRYLQANDVVNVEDLPAPTTHPAILPADSPVMPGQTARYSVEGKGIRAGWFDLTGREITVKQALISAGFFPTGNLQGRSVVLVRHGGTSKQSRTTVQIDDLFFGRVADRFLQANDLIIVQADPTTQPATTQPITTHSTVLPEPGSNSANGLTIDCRPSRDEVRVGEKVLIWCTLTNSTKQTKPVAYNTTGGSHFTLISGVEAFEKRGNNMQGLRGGLLPLAIPHIREPLTVRSGSPETEQILDLPPGKSIQFVLDCGPAEKPQNFTGRIVYDPLASRGALVLRPDDLLAMSVSNVFTYRIAEQQGKP